MNYAKGGDVARALQRLMAALKQDSELAPQVAHLQGQAEAAVPRVAEPVIPRSTSQQMADQAVENVGPRQRFPQPPDRLVARLRGNDLVSPEELNHLLYSSPEATQAINAYQGAMDSNTVTPEMRAKLAELLDHQASIGPTVMNPNVGGMAKGGDIFRRLRELSDRLGDTTATISDLGVAREARDNNAFRSQLFDRMQERLKAKSDLVGPLQHQYQPGDIVQGERGPVKILALDATQHYPEDVEALKSGRPLPPLSERKLRPHLPAYHAEGADGSRFTMAEWGIKGPYGGPRVVQLPGADQTLLGNQVPLTNEDASIFERNGERGLGEQMDHAESHDRDAEIMRNPPEEKAEGGGVDEPFDPVRSARERAYPSSSPGSPGLGGAIKDAIEALQGYLSAGQREIADDRDQQIMHQAEDHADGGTVDGPSTEHEAGLGKRFGVRVMEQAYGLDDKGEPAFGGRAWTSGQGGTPLGILDEITAAPHNLLSLLKTTRGLDPLRKRFGDPGMENRMIDAVDPQWSQAAAMRLDALRAAMNDKYHVGEAHTLPEHMTDAAASLVSPIPMTKVGEAAGPLKRLLEMTVPVRPRTAKTFSQDTAMLGGLSTGIDALTDRLSRLHGQAGSGGGQQTDPRDFSTAMGVHLDDTENESRDIHNSHQMIPMVSSNGNIYYGVDPGTL